MGDERIDFNSPELPKSVRWARTFAVVVVTAVIAVAALIAGVIGVVYWYLGRPTPAPSRARTAIEAAPNCAALASLVTDYSGNADSDFTASAACKEAKKAMLQRQCGAPSDPCY